MQKMPRWEPDIVLGSMAPLENICEGFLWFSNVINSAVEICSCFILLTYTVWVLDGSKGATIFLRYTPYKTILWGPLHRCARLQLPCWAVFPTICTICDPTYWYMFTHLEFFLPINFPFID